MAFIIEVSQEDTKNLNSYLQLIQYLLKNNSRPILSFDLTSPIFPNFAIARDTVTDIISESRTSKISIPVIISLSGNTPQNISEPTTFIKDLLTSTIAPRSSYRLERITFELLTIEELLLSTRTPTAQ